MSYFFADGFDLYTAPADASAGYWDSSGSLAGAVLQPGRFSGGRCLRLLDSNTIYLTKASGVNDAVHHVSCAIYQGAALSGSGGCFFQLLDGVTNQCCIWFRQDGAIVLTNGANNGTIQATYTGAITAQNVWFSFEIEVVIHNTAGSFTVRKNGNPSADFTATNLNTRTSANNYANKLSLGTNFFGINYQQFDDILWRSFFDASTATWSGDARCYTRMPVSDASVQFAKSPVAVSFFFSTNSANGAGPTANLIWYYSIQSPHSGNITALLANFVVGVTAHVNMAVYDATGAIMTSGNSGAAASGSPGPGNLLGTATPLTNPASGMQTFTLVTPAPVTKNQILWVAMIADAAITTAIPGGGALISPALSYTYTGGAFPATSAGFTMTASRNGFSYLGAIVAPANAALVNEPQQDGTTTYVYDATPGHADFYNLDQIATPSVQRLGLVTRGFVAKGDAGTRAGTMQLKSGAATAVAPTLVLASSFLWSWRSDTLNPATGTAWTDATANAVTAGPSVVA